jgi:hypothetical protein
METPSWPCDGITMDFVSELPQSTSSGYCGIVHILDRLTEMGSFLLCPKDIDLPELVRLLFEHIICKRGIPDKILTDHSTLFTS